MFYETSAADISLDQITHNSTRLTIRRTILEKNVTLGSNGCSISSPYMYRLEYRADKDGINYTLQQQRYLQSCNGCYC